MGDGQASVPTGPCQFPGCDGTARDGHAYCFDCRRELEEDLEEP